MSSKHAVYEWCKAVQIYKRLSYHYCWVLKISPYGKHKQVLISFPNTYDRKKNIEVWLRLFKNICCKLKKIKKLLRSKKSKSIKKVKWVNNKCSVRP